MYYIYAISSINKKYIYVGITNDIDNRFYRHNKGRERTTKFYLPYKLIFLSWAKNRNLVRQLELYFKSGIGKEFLKILK